MKPSTFLPRLHLSPILKSHLRRLSCRRHRRPNALPRRVPRLNPTFRPKLASPMPRLCASISKGVDFLLGRFSGPELNGTFEHYEGLDTLTVYGAMQAELATRDKRLDIHGPFMMNAIDAMKKFPMSGDYVTYARSLRATALALNDRPQDHWLIREDVNWLLQAQEHGDLHLQQRIRTRKRFCVLG